MASQSPLARFLSIFTALFGVASTHLPAEVPSNFKTENLAAWCVAHRWDAENRSPDARAQMLRDLGVGRLAYNWTKQDNPDFEAEILATQKYGINYFAFWNEDETAFALFEKYGLHPQIWKTCPSPTGDTQSERVAFAVKRLAPFAQRARELGSQFGLYNHRGWGGHPENLVAVCQELRRLGYDNVGIVYNFHHSHDEMDRFADYLALMQPYLLCINLNGMADQNTVDPKVLTTMIHPIGSQQHEAAMIKTVIASGYVGPIGIIGHTEGLDTAQVLRQNLVGLVTILDRLTMPDPNRPIKMD